MNRSRYQTDEYVEREDELNRRLEIAAEQEPAWAHYQPRNPICRPRRRYFSGMMFRPVAQPVDETEGSEHGDR